MFKTSFETKFSSADGAPTGFNYLRIAFSVAIVVWHTNIVVYGPSVDRESWAGPLHPLLFAIVPAFFSFSGFLVAGSLVRNNDILAFLTLRALRIFPALSIIVLATALVIGPLLTNLPLSQYFSDPLFFKYFLNIAGYMQFHLPGLFLDNPFSSTNSQFWTIPFELRSYIYLAVLGFFGLTRWPVLIGIAALFLTLRGLFYDLQAILSGTLIFSDAPEGRMLIVCFFWGVFLYLNRHRIPYHFGLFLSALAVTLICFSFAGLAYAGTLPLTYAVVYIGLQNPKKTFIVGAGDFSYGVYIYGFPIQQSVYQLLPGFRAWYLHLAISLPLTILFSYLSWTLIESRILKAKKPAVEFVKRLRARIWSGWLTKASNETADFDPQHWPVLIKDRVARRKSRLS